MSAALPLTAPTGTVPAMEAVARVHAVLDTVDTEPIGPVAGRDIAEVDRAIARMEALKLRLVAAADRQNAGSRAGMAGTAAWLAATTRSWGGKAAADVSLATALDDHLPATKEALAAGQMSTAHAGVIAGATSRLPETLTEAERTRIETALVAQARHLDPARLRRSARRALLSAERTAAESAAHEDAELRSEEARAEARVRLTMHDNQDGTVTGHFTVPALAGAILRKVVQQIASPRRQRGAVGPGTGEAVGLSVDPTAAAASSTRHGATASSTRHAATEASTRHGATEASTGRGATEASTRQGAMEASTRHGATESSTRQGATESSTRHRATESSTRHRATESSTGQQATPPSMRTDVDWAERYGAAFVELLEHLPTDRLTGKVAATVVVTIDHDKLRQSLGAAQLDTGHDLSAAEVRRLACSAGILPAVLNGTSLPLDLGRANRFFSEAQRVALATTYDECASEGCDRPYAWSELHHEDPWARGGSTDLHLAVPLCRFHHRRAHDPSYDHRIRTDAMGRKSVTYHRRP
jgi:hypothetical protein